MWIFSLKNPMKKRQPVSVEHHRYFFMHWVIFSAKNVIYPILNPVVECCTRSLIFWLAFILFKLTGWTYWFEMVSNFSTQNTFTTAPAVFCHWIFQIEINFILNLKLPAFFWEFDKKFINWCPWNVSNVRLIVKLLVTHKIGNNRRTKLMENEFTIEN